MDTCYDLVVIGAGPIGLACGLEAQEAGLRYVIIEKGTLVDSIYRYPANMTFFSSSERLEIGGVPFVSQNAKPSRSEALEYYRRVAESKRLDIRLYENVEQVTPLEQGPGYCVETAKGNYLTHNIALATGFYGLPVKLGIPGEDLPKVTHYYAEPHPYYRQQLVVVGANNSAVDAALETWRKGAEVTMVVRGDDIGERVKYWARPDIVNRIREGSIRAFFNAELSAIRPAEVDIRTPDGLLTLPNDYVIAATGYLPNFDFLRGMGIELSADEQLRPSYHPDTQ
ncbi:MAG TPA: YpdA family putative bacillithiol disulfide reductase, partial [Saprospiraceae bacterium]|nr:YpdA family putative bacillithiol disulfide reductase [Saprospiraceae bacterium]